MSTIKNRKQVPGDKAMNKNLITLRHRFISSIIKCIFQIKYHLPLVQK